MASLWIGAALFLVGAALHGAGPGVGVAVARAFQVRAVAGYLVM